jgi:SAM-dependent methyltransferase
MICMTDYNLYKGKIRTKVLDKNNKVSGINVDNIFFNNVYSIINFYLKKKGKLNILDIGTGTGFVPIKIISKYKNKINKNIFIDAFDISKDLLNIAKEKDNLTQYILLTENTKILKKYDLVINRLCPRCDINKIDGFIKKNGVYIYKEYDNYRGLKEIFLLFKKKWISRNNSGFYYNKLDELGYKYLYLKKYIYKRKYSIKNIDNILKSTNIVKNYSLKDYKIILSNLGNNFFITQDPYILICSKNINFIEEIIK